MGTQYQDKEVLVFREVLFTVLVFRGQCWDSRTQTLVFGCLVKVVRKWKVDLVIVFQDHNPDEREWVFPCEQVARKHLHLH